MSHRGRGVRQMQKKVSRIIFYGPFSPWWHPTQLSVLLIWQRFIHRNDIFCFAIKNSSSYQIVQQQHNYRCATRRWREFRCTGRCVGEKSWLFRKTVTLRGKDARGNASWCGWRHLKHKKVGSGRLWTAKSIDYQRLRWVMRKFVSTPSMLKVCFWVSPLSNTTFSQTIH